MLKSLNLFFCSQKSLISQQLIVIDTLSLFEFIWILQMTIKSSILIISIHIINRKIIDEVFQRGGNEKFQRGDDGFFLQSKLCHCHLIQNLVSGLFVGNLKISWTKLQPGRDADSEQVSGVKVKSPFIYQTSRSHSQR